MDCRSKSVAFSPSCADRHVITAPVTDTRPMSTAMTSLRSTATRPIRRVRAGACPPGQAGTAASLTPGDASRHLDGGEHVLEGGLVLGLDEVDLGDQPASAGHPGEDLEGVA